MTPLQIVFLIVAAATLISAVMVVSARRVMHAALWLVLTLFGVAVLFVTLETGFFAVVQVVVYIGAIAILIIFAVMLTRRDEQDLGLQSNRFGRASLHGVLSALVALGVAGGLIGALSGWQAFSAGRPPLAEQNIDNVAALGNALVSPNAYAIPFEVASVLLIGALIGAIYVANEQRR
jgi:NADH-quinone oxidoreductase subunit J